MKFLCLLGALLASVTTQAAPLNPQDCTSTQNISGALVVNRFYTMSLGCLVQVTPKDKPNLVYREYYFDERGRFLDFHSQAGDYATSTANRAYFLFPRRQYPSYRLLGDGTIVVTMASGGEARFDPKAAAMADLTGASFREPSGAGLGADDFLEIDHYSGLLLDAGWRVGDYAYFLPSGKSKFRDASGKVCEVGNQELFDYEHILYGEPTFLFETDEKLHAFLGTRCPELHW